MMEFMRAASKTWVAAILIGFLIMGFALFGINDIFSTGQATTLAKVGEARLTAVEFDNEFTRRVRQIEGPGGRPMTIGEARVLGYDRVIFESMVSDLAVSEEARRLNLAASDEMVRDEIASIQGIQAPSGAIDQAQFARLLQSMGMREADFVELVRSSVILRQLLQTAAVGAPAPKGMSVALLAYENERRSVEYVVLPAEKAGEVAAPDEAALQAYLEANAAAYTAPQLHAITLLTIGTDDLKKNIQVSDDEVRAQYEVQKRQFETPETRVLQQIVYADKAAAEAARKLIDEGKTFEDLAAAQSLKPEDIALGVIEKGDVAVPAGAFEIKEGEISQPLEGPFGWVLIRAVTVTPGTTKPFEEVQAQLRDEVALTLAINQIGEISSKLQDELAATDALDQVAGKLGMTVRTIPAIDAQGRDADGKPIEGLPDGPDFLTDMMAGEPGDRSDVAETPGHVLYVIRTDSVTPPALRPLAAVKDALTAAWIADQQTTRLKALADEVVARANAAGTSLADVAKELGLPAKSAETLSRNAAAEDLSQELVTSLFNAPQGAWMSGPGSAAPSIVIARVSAVTSAPVDDMAGAELAIRQAETQAISRDLADTYRNAIRAVTPVEIDETLYETVRRRGQ
jgi:peptidyl-prolyl cis-trans isomerase D